MRDGTTALMLAVGLGASATQDRRGVALIDGGRRAGEDLVLPTVEAVLEGGADANATNQAGDTALHAAAAGGLNRVVSRLVAAGATVNVKNGRGQTPLGAIAARQDRRDTADLLRRSGDRVEGRLQTGPMMGRLKAAPTATRSARTPAGSRYSPLALACRRSSRRRA